MNKENPRRAPFQGEQAAGLEKTIHSEILGEHPNDASVDDEKVPARLEVVDEADDPLAELKVGLAAGR